MISDGLKFGLFRNSSQKCYHFPGLSVVFFFTAKLGNYRGHVSHSYIQLYLPLFFSFLAICLSCLYFNRTRMSEQLKALIAWMLNTPCSLSYSCERGEWFLQDPALKAYALWTRSLCWALQTPSECGH